MNSKNIRSLRKLLLLLGASLCGLIILQAGHEVVKALDLNLVPPEDLGASEQSEVVSPITPDERSVTHPSSVTHQNSDTPAPKSSPSLRTAATSPANLPTGSAASSESSAADQPESESIRRQLLAINTGEAGTGQQPVSQISPDQIATSATNQWYGASFPVEHFQAYTSPFGYRQSPDGGYSTEFHYGLDMAAPEGSYIRNWWTGKVVEVSDDSNCGTSVVVESGTWMHIYCHMQGHVEQQEKGRYLIDREGGIQIWEGQDIAAGARIGRVGMTGRTTGPHLHWGLKFDENWVDPALVLRAMYVSQQSAARPTEDQAQ